MAKKRALKRTRIIFKIISENDNIIGYKGVNSILSDSQNRFGISN